MRDAWDVLGIPPTENKRAIKKAYAKKVAEYHPEEFPIEFQEIQEAYTFLINIMNRDYDENQDNIMDLTKAFQRKSTLHTKDFNTKKAETIDIDWSSIDAKNNSDDDVDLDWSKIDASDGPNHNEQQQLQNFYIIKFKERMNYSKSLKMMQILISNRDFYKQMRKRSFYDEITRIIAQELSSFDMFTRSFLYDSFISIREQNQFQQDDSDLPTTIKRFEHKQRIKAKIKLIIRRSLWILFALFILSGLISSILNE